VAVKQGEDDRKRVVNRPLFFWAHATDSPAETARVHRAQLLYEHASALPAHGDLGPKRRRPRAL
jgi:hypothetical protein